MGVQPCLDALIDRYRSAYLSMLAELVSIPSVSAVQGEAMRQAAHRVADMLAQEGARVETWVVSGGPPIVYGRIDGGGPFDLLFYDHYDVQPAEPLDAWRTDPWRLVEDGGVLYGRGVADNKGDLISRLLAVRVLREAGRLPVSVGFLVEGEEEVGSPRLEPCLARHRGRIRADACVWEFGGRDRAGRLLVYAGLKGIAYVELAVTVADHDLHSSMGAVVEGAVNRLVRALYTLFTEDGRVAVDGFYDAVRPTRRDEIRQALALPFDAGELRRDFGVRHLWPGRGGRRGSIPFLYGPACTVCGIEGGYRGPGSKTVLPHEALAKVDFRLVPDQDPQEVLRLIRRHLDARGFTDVELRDLGGQRAFRSDLRHPFVGRAVKSFERSTGRKVVLYPTSSGSGPMWPVASSLGVPILSAGLGYWANLAHAPNENVRLSDFDETVRMMAHLMMDLARDGKEEAS